MDKYTEIEKFYDLKERGIISEEEFKKEKEKILKPKEIKISHIEERINIINVFWCLIILSVILFTII